MTNDNNRFKVFAGLQKSLGDGHVYKENDEGSITITGLASTTNKDLQEDVISKSCIESMKQQAAELNLMGDHWYGWKEVVGSIDEVLDTTEDDLTIKATVRPKYAGELKEELDYNCKLGLSIGGDIKDFTQLPDGGFQIEDIHLFEISLTALPANWDSFGTITTSKGMVKSNCLTGACYQVMKNLNKGEKNMATENENQTNNENNNENNQEEGNDKPLTEQDCADLFNELFAEKSDELKKEVVDEVKQDLEKIVEDKMSKEEEKETEGETEGETTTEEDGTEKGECSEEENPEDNTSEGEQKPEDNKEDETEKGECGSDNKDEKKYLTNEDVENAVQKRLEEMFGENPAETIASKMWDTKTQNRNPNSAAMEAMRKLSEQSSESDETAKMYSPEEAAEMLLKSNKNNNILSKFLQ